MMTVLSRTLFAISLLLSPVAGKAVLPPQDEVHQCNPNIQRC